MLSPSFVFWWRGLPSDAKQDLCIACDIPYQYISNICHLKNSLPLTRAVNIVLYSEILSSKYGSPILQISDIDTDIAPGLQLRRL